MIRKKRYAVVQSAQCVACGSCVKACPRGAITVLHGVCAVVEKAACVGCGLCAKACPASVILLESEEMQHENEKKALV